MGGGGGAHSTYHSHFCMQCQLVCAVGLLASLAYLTSLKVVAVSAGCGAVVAAAAVVYQHAACIRKLYLCSTAPVARARGVYGVVWAGCGSCSHTLVLCCHGRRVWKYCADVLVDTCTPILISCVLLHAAVNDAQVVTRRVGQFACSSRGGSGAACHSCAAAVGVGIGGSKHVPLLFQWDMKVGEGLTAGRLGFES